MLTKQEFASFRKEAEKLLQGLANKYNANIKAGRIKYTDNSFNLDFRNNKKRSRWKIF